MIVPMQKMSLIVFHKHKDDLLHDLRDLGLVHINIKDELGSENLENFKSELTKSEKTYFEIEQIYNRKIKAGEDIPQRDRGNPEDILADFNNIQEQENKIIQKKENLQNTINELKPWGEFDPEIIKKLQDKQLKIRFITIPRKNYEVLHEQPNYEKLHLFIINKTKTKIYGIIPEINPGQKDVTNRFVQSSFFEEQELPLIAISGAHREIAACDEKLKELSAQKEDLVRYKNFLHAYIVYEQNNITLEETKLSMDAVIDNKAFFIEGWFPAKVKYPVAECLDEYPVWYKIEKPHEDDNVPVKVENPPLFNLFQPITKILSLPDYYELDPTPFFAPFFAFFFGLCLGDAGYGLVLMALAVVAKLKLKKEKLQVFINLAIIFGVFTTINGFLLNTLFGQPIFSLPGNPGAFFDNSTISSWATLGSYVKQGDQQFPAMAFALYIGVFQIILGMILHGINRVRNKGILYFISPLGKICLALASVIILANIYNHKGFMDIGTFSFGILPVGYFFGTYIPFETGVILSIIGVVLLCFEDPKKNIVIQFLKAPLNIYNFASGFAADSLSYIRLFALGLAGGLLGNAFNQIALMFIKTESGYNPATPLLFFTILVLLVGHVLNFGLAALGAFVHSLRLTFVEFYNNLEFTGGSKPYRPLRKYH